MRRTFGSKCERDWQTIGIHMRALSLTVSSIRINCYCLVFAGIGSVFPKITAYKQTILIIQYKLILLSIVSSSINTAVIVLQKRTFVSQLSVSTSKMLKAHQCRRKNPQEDILCQVIETGIFINFRRRCLRFTMINKNHPMTSMHYKSQQSIRLEEIRHIANYPYIVHPLSMFALYWEFLIFLVYTVFWVIMSMIAANEVKNYESYRVKTIIFIDSVFTIDIIKMFVTGYYNDERSRTVLMPSKIARRYLKSYFVLDVLSLLQSHFSLIYVRYPSFVIEEIVLILRIVVTMRILRLARWKNTLELFHLYANLTSFFHRALRAILLYTIILLWLYAIVFQLNIILDRNLEVEVGCWEDPMYKTYYSATLLLMRVSAITIDMNHNHRILVAVFAIGLGYCLQLFLYTQILQVWIKFSNARSKNESQFQQFTEYLKYKDLPVGLRNKFISFYKFKFQNQFYNEARINRMVSKILKQEILVYVTKNHVQKVEFFKDMPDTVLAKLVSRLKSEIYLGNDVILTAGVAGSCMYFIYFGTVAIYSPGGKEICHLEDGAHFGEIALIFNEPRVATVKAVTPCELFTLNRSDFLEVLEPYPDIKDKITLLAQERLRTTGFLEE